MSFLNRKPWTRQPPVGTQIDWGNPLSRGLIYAKSFMGGVGAQTDIDDTIPEIITGIRPSIVDFTDGYSVADRSGPVQYLDATGVASDYYDSHFTPSLFGSGKKFSVLVVVRTTDQDGTYAAQRDIDEAQWQLFTQANLLRFRATGDLVNLDITGVYTDGNWHTIAMSREQGADVTAFIDGKIGGEGVATLAATGVTDTINLSIGNRWQTYPGTGFEMDGDFALFLLWEDRKLTAEEQWAIAQNPWQVFAPLRPTFSFDVGRSVSAALETLAIAELAATISRTRSMTGVLETLAIAELAATVNRTSSLTTVLETLSIAELVATISLGGRTASTVVDALTIATFDAVIDTSVHPGDGMTGMDFKTIVDTLKNAEAENRPASQPSYHFTRRHFTQQGDED